MISWIASLFAIAKPAPVVATDTPRPGDLIVYPGRYLLGRRVAIGHVGVIVDDEGIASPHLTVMLASAMVGKGIYGLGKGGRHPEARTPFDKDGLLDCSGLASWCLGLDRYQPGRIDGDWISTDSIVRDAKGPRRMFALVCAAPADLRVVHCHGPSGKGPAVSVSTSALWARKKGVVVRLR